MNNSMRILIGFIITLFLFSCAYASQFTINYGFEIPSILSRDWLPAISQDIISIDAIIKAISDDLGTASEKIIISNDGVKIIGGVVGRIRIISQDGNPSYILIYAGS